MIFGIKVLQGKIVALSRCGGTVINIHGPAGLCSRQVQPPSWGSPVCERHPSQQSRSAGCRGNTTRARCEMSSVTPMARLYCKMWWP